MCSSRWLYLPTVRAKVEAFLVGSLQTTGTSLSTAGTLCIWELTCFNLTENEEFISLTSIFAFALWIQVQQKHNIYSLDESNYEVCLFFKAQKVSISESWGANTHSWAVTADGCSESESVLVSKLLQRSESRANAAAPPLSHVGLEEVNWCCSCFGQGATDCKRALSPPETASYRPLPAVGTCTKTPWNSPPVSSLLTDLCFTTVTAWCHSEITSLMMSTTKSQR